MFIYQWLHSRRLQLWAATIACYTLWMSLARVGFYAWFARFEGDAPGWLEMLRVFYIGVKFDLRLAILICLPLVLLCIVPRINLFRIRALGALSQWLLAVMTIGLVLFYVFDFGHYSYLGLRINSGFLRFLDDRESATMVRQSYPLIRIAVACTICCFVMIDVNRRLHRWCTARAPTRISAWSALIGVVCCCIAAFFGLLGRYSDINFHNPIPLRWDAVSFTQNKTLAAAGVNPLVHFATTFQYDDREYDLAAVARYYDVVADYLGVVERDRATFSLDREIAAPTDSPIDAQLLRAPSTVSNATSNAPPNVIFIMLESLGASRVGAYGLPLDATPNLDRAARNGIMFSNFLVPVSGTAKTVWASTTGIPDTTTHDTATRNPLLSRQRMIVNQLRAHQKLYLIGGNASWANISALIEQSIDGVRLYKEGDWQSEVTDVWGISDLALFTESDAILRKLHARNQPFFAIVQTAGNHRPFTIPEQRGDFAPSDLSADTLHQHGFLSNAQFNAARFLDYAVGEFFAMAKASGYFDNTIFVLYGDHNNRVSTTPHMAPFYQRLQIEGLHVPGIIHAPKLIAPMRIDQAVSLVDLMPSVAGLLGAAYTNGGFGRDVLQPPRDDARYVFVSTGSSTNPIIGMINENYMLRKFARRETATLHHLHAADPQADISAAHPQLFDYLHSLTQGVYELSRYQMYNNRKQ